MAHEASYFQELGGAKTQLAFHRPCPILFGLFYRCEDPECREFSRERGCTTRRSNLEIFLRLADAAERWAAVEAGYLILDVEKNNVLARRPAVPAPAAAEPPAPAASFRATAPVPRSPEAAVSRTVPDFGRARHPAPRPITPRGMARPVPPTRTGVPS